MEITDVENLILNMMSGLLPEQLTEKDCELLEEKYGSDWFHHLGYDDTYKKPLSKVES